MTRAGGLRGAWPTGMRSLLMFTVPHWRLLSLSSSSDIAAAAIISSQMKTTTNFQVEQLDVALLAFLLCHRHNSPDGRCHVDALD